MDAKDPDPADEWPLPPVWMWGCGECALLYKAMKRAPEAVAAAREEGGPGIDHDPMDTVVSTQIRLARHIALQHSEDVPEPDDTCKRCTSDRTSRTMPPELVMEHRARHLFAPPSIAGLL